MLVKVIVHREIILLTLADTTLIVNQYREGKSFVKRLMKLIVFFFFKDIPFVLWVNELIKMASLNAGKKKYNSHLVYTRIQLIYSDIDWQLIKKILEDQTSACWKRLRWCQNSRERRIIIVDSLFSVKFLKEKRSFWHVIR